MSLPVISPRDAQHRLAEGAILVDLREADEHAREKIAGARHAPLSRLEGLRPIAAEGRPLLIHCRSGMRTSANAGRIAAELSGCEAFLIEGGLDAWRKAGLPVAKDRRQPIDLQRQTQIGAGGLALAGVTLGHFVAPGFYLLSGFVGAGLLVAGVTGFCGMARLLAHAPWNAPLRRGQAPT